MEYPIQRNIDSAYFRVSRNGALENVCFTDLTDAEQKKLFNHLIPRR